ncbi:hypothetical protein CgunFtcFv8_017562 [Champsocephalus gunnari]|uniref:Uncharacterized protein n=1 Tax=Champsocephalus gunnari TaxID=52237 RepID=A0AAN8HV16_CHAGU|nr:hypothetical protein CgunFtcFv8_017562 [Champsocephalus gunnari]
MAASKKKSLPLRHLTDTFTNQREQMLKKSHLQERWQELKERELIAQQNNRQLLQQFDEAQDTLREMITLTADMTTIRMEYERYLEESYPRWQQQLERKTQSAQRQSMEEYLRSCRNNREERVSTSSADRPFNSKGPTSMSQQMAAPPNHYSQNLHMDYNQHGSPRLPYIQTSWQPPTQFQRATFPIRAQYQPQGYSHVPPSFPQHPDPYHHQHLDSPPGYHHRQDAPGWAPLQPEPPWPLAAGAAGISACSQALWGPLYREEPPPEIKVTEKEVDTSLAPSSKREGGSGGGRNSHFSQELDIKPVRLSGGLAESTESSGESSQGSREKKKRGTSQKASLDSCSSHKSSESSSAIVIAAATAAQNSESDASSEKSSTSRRKRRGVGLAVGSPSAEKLGEGSKGDNSGSHREESRSTRTELGGLIEEARIEEGGNQRHGDNSESCGEESGSQREESGSQREESGSRGGVWTCLCKD